jgi:7-cyano-7-deazaguanine synthase
MLHVKYGQRTERRELDAFQKIVEWYRPEKSLVLRLDYLSVIGGSSLTDAALPIPAAQDVGTTVPSTYVPFRNAGLLSAAVSWAEVLDAEAVYIGAVEQDSSGYPDCREGFLTAFGEAVRRGTRDARIAIQAPLVRMTKGEIVRLGISLDAPLKYTWSCYRRDDVACGTCASCTLRLQGFEQAGIRDPIPYVEQNTAASVAATRQDQQSTSSPEEHHA